jgi:hypothetical protein
VEIEGHKLDLTIDISMEERQKRIANAIRSSKQYHHLREHKKTASQLLFGEQIFSELNNPRLVVIDTGE